MKALIAALLIAFAAPIFAQPYELEVAVVCDDSFFAEYGDDSHDRVIDLFTIVSGLFETHFNITIHLNTVILSEDFNTPVDFSGTGNTLLTSFASYMQNNWSAIYQYDVSILLHNETFTPGGQSYQPAACNANPNFRYSYARDLPNNLNLSAYLIAHELGHSVGASHDTTFPPGGGFWLMWPTVSGSNTIPEFSPQSEAQVAAYLAGVTCLDNAPPQPKWWFVRGDVNNDGFLDVSDATAILDYAFNGSLPPFCLQAGDINDDGLILGSDAISLLNYLFLQGMPPAFPFPAYGPDLSFDGIPCGGL